MAKRKQSVTREKFTVCTGVGLDLTPNEHGYRKTHYVVLRCSHFSGVDVFGPFLTEEAGHEFIRTRADGEMYERFGKATVPGVSWCVQWLDVPVTYGYE